MKKSNFKKMDVDLFEEQLDNGLKVYIIPKNNVNDIYVTFSTNFGAVNNEFTNKDSRELIKVPDGIAHFLEHQVFNQKDGTNPLNFFTSNGASGNANTSFFKTTYLFSGTDSFKENLTYLLDYVQEPYFTDKSVEKEKGIIEQEINMYLDDPYTRCYEVLNRNMFNKHPIKNNIIGSVKSIRTITKEDLYNCYNTFYHPSNMFIVITGNVDPDEAISIIKENQDNKEFEKIDKIELPVYDEPDSVEKDYEELNMNVMIPKVLIGYKFNVKDIDMKQYIFRWYLSIFANSKFGPTSLFWEDLKDKNILTDYIGYSLLCTDDHAVLILDAETDKTDTFIDMVKEEIKDFNIDEEEFERKKKVFLSSTIFMSDNIYSMNQTAMSSIIDEGFVRCDIYEDIKNLTYDKFKDIITNLDFDNNATVVVKPNEE